VARDETDVFYLLLFIAALFCFAALIHRSMHPDPIDACIDACEMECIKDANSKRIDK
jgi:hypothetical protein